MMQAISQNLATAWSCSANRADINYAFEGTDLEQNRAVNI
jgi:hypothetical protein